MKRLFLAAVTAVSLAGCISLHHGGNTNPYEKPLFYSRYLSTSNPLDQQIQRRVDALRANPDSPQLHNELGMLLSQKGFPKDAELEFERSVDADGRYYPGWYNLGLMRAGRGNFAGARHAFARTVHYKPGHAAALFQLGLMEEKQHNEERAVEYYAKAFQINHQLLDVAVNPRILDSHLVHLALIQAYPNTHTRASLAFQDGPTAGYQTPGVAKTDTLVAPAAVTTTAPPPTPSTMPSAAKPVSDPSRTQPPANIPAAPTAPANITAVPNATPVPPVNKRP